MTMDSREESYVCSFLSVLLKNLFYLLGSKENPSRMSLDLYTSINAAKDTSKSYCTGVTSLSIPGDSEMPLTVNCTLDRLVYHSLKTAEKISMATIL